ncbi:hypothetical protein Acid7E03_26430 [Acidisoma sp. 7E03]
MLAEEGHKPETVFVQGITAVARHKAHLEARSKKPLDGAAYLSKARSGGVAHSGFHPLLRYRRIGSQWPADW